MLLNTRTTRNILEGAEAAGIDRARILSGIDLTEAELVDEGAKVSWDTVVMLTARISDLVGGDAARLQAMGVHMSFAPAYANIAAVARAIVSVRTIYDISARWLTPTNFPHLRVRTAWPSEDRLELTAWIPEPYSPSLPFFQIATGAIVSVPVLVGLEPAVIIERDIEPRAMRVLIALPPPDTFIARARRRVRALAGTRGALDVLHQQREELSDHFIELQRARDELRAVLERLPDLVVVQSEERFVWVNRAFVQAVGYRLEEIVGTPVLSIIADRYKASVALRMQQEPDAPRQSPFIEVAWKTRHGDEFLVEVAIAQKVVFDGKPARLVVARDITDRMNMQQRLLIADRLASVGLLAAGVAHEVNNPLAYVLNNIEIARKELTGVDESSERSRHVLSIALEGVDRIRAIVRDLLMLAREDDGPVQAIDVRAVAASTLALAAHEIERTSELVQVFETAPMVLASQARVAQVLLNLITNALEAMRERPRAGNRLIVRLTTAPDGRLRLEVGDNGVGISESDLERLFEPFFTTKRGGQGTGLGLAITQRLVVELGGEISVTSSLGHGATFTVHLPAAPSSA